MNILKQTDPLIPLAAAFALFISTSSDPWWSLSGANSKLLAMVVSPFYFHADATGISSTVPFAALLGSFTRILLIFAFLALGMAVLNPRAWWRELAVYFSLSALIELYLSFLLLYHAAETTLLGAYGVVPPYTGTTNLPTTIVGLDLSSYLRPLVTAGFGLSFYLGFVALGLVGASLVLDTVRGREKPKQRGVAAVFTSEEE